jgi:general secretion pathway protein A
MYLTHFNFTIMPFETSPDPKFLWLSEKHKEALASLKYGIRENKGFLLLTGDIGTGKTTLINCFLNENDTNAIITAIPDPDLSIVDFFELLSVEFNIKLDFDSKGEFLVQFENFLHNTYSDRKKALLIMKPKDSTRDFWNKFVF